MRNADAFFVFSSESAKGGSIARKPQILHEPSEVDIEMCGKAILLDTLL
jgi:hypothetical protein